MATRGDCPWPRPQRRTPTVDLEELDATVEDAIRAGAPRGLRVLGYGEITLVLGWPTEQPGVAVKRLPLFRDAARCDALRRARWSATRPRCASAASRWSPPRCARSRRAPAPAARVPRAAARAARAHAQRDPAHGRRRERGAALLRALVGDGRRARSTRGSGSTRRPPNWAVDGERLALLRRLDADAARRRRARRSSTSTLFLSIYPWALRAAAGARSPTASWRSTTTRAPCCSTSPPTCIKERLDRWLPALLERGERARRRRRSPPRCAATSARDKLLWPLMQRLRRADRGWQRHVRRRPYPFLLPPPVPLRPARDYPRRSPMTVTHDLPATNAEALRADRRSTSRRTRPTAYQAVGMDLVQGRREGVRVWDLDGRDYINCRSSGGVFNFGHHPAFAVEALTAALAEHDMGDWLLPSARRARGRRGAGAAAARAAALHVLHRLGRRGRRGRLQARALGHRPAGLRLRRARLPRPRRLLAGDGRSAAVGPLPAADAGDHAGPVRRRRAPSRRDRRRHRGRDHGDDPGHRRVPRARRTGYFAGDAPALRRARRAADPRRGAGRARPHRARCGRSSTSTSCPTCSSSARAPSAGVYPIAACCFGDRVEAHFAEDPFFHPSSYAGSELGARGRRGGRRALRGPGAAGSTSNAMGERLRGGLRRARRRATPTGSPGTAASA